jgi:hypothetical protein
VPILLLLLTLTADTALAGWGPFGGGAILNVKDPGIGRFTGWEAGLTLADSGNRGFWQFAGGRGTSHVDHSELTAAQARLNFKVGATQASMLYLGTGGALNWIDHAGVTRRIWSLSTQAGILFAPDRAFGAIKNKAPISNQMMTPGGTMPTATDGVLSSHILLGIEAGYHTGRLSFSGLESRAFLTITY